MEKVLENHLILKSIGRYLDLKELMVIRKVCKLWNSAFLREMSMRNLSTNFLKNDRSVRTGDPMVDNDYARAFSDTNSFEEYVDTWLNSEIVPIKNYYMTKLPVDQLKLTCPTFIKFLKLPIKALYFTFRPTRIEPLDFDILQEILFLTSQRLESLGLTLYNDYKDITRFRPQDIFDYEDEEEDENDYVWGNLRNITLEIHGQDVFHEQFLRDIFKSSVLAQSLTFKFFSFNRNYTLSMQMIRNENLFPNVTDLNLSWIRLYDQDVIDLTNVCKKIKLKKLFVDSIDNKVNITIMNELIRTLSPTLEYLDFFTTHPRFNLCPMPLMKVFKVREWYYLGPLSQTLSLMPNLTQARLMGTILKIEEDPATYEQEIHTIQTNIASLANLRVPMANMKIINYSHFRTHQFSVGRSFYEKIADFPMHILVNVFPNLQTLDLEANDQEFLIICRHLTQLRTLIIADTNVSDETVTGIEASHRHYLLNLPYIFWPDNFGEKTEKIVHYNEIRRLKNLETFKISLDYKNSRNLTDISIYFGLRFLPKLKYLSMFNTSMISERSLKIFEEHFDLRRLEFDKNDLLLFKDAVDSLRKSKPYLRVG